MAYIDTSVLVAYYCPEERSEAAQRAVHDGQPHISALTEVEFCSAVATKVRTGEMPATEADRVLAMFEQHVAAGGYRMLPLGPGQFSLARQWIGRRAVPLRTLDALHLAVAASASVPLVTADAVLARAAECFRVDCQLL